MPAINFTLPNVPGSNHRFPVPGFSGVLVDLQIWETQVVCRVIAPDEPSKAKRAEFTIEQSALARGSVMPGMSEDSFFSAPAVVLLNGVLLYSNIPDSEEHAARINERLEDFG